MKIMTNVEIVWSVIVFFFKAAHMPNKIPMGTEKITDKIFSRIEYPIREPMMTPAETLGWNVLLYPQSHFVTMFFSQFVYCFMTGTI